MVAELTKSWKPLFFHPEQWKLWNTRAKFIAAAAGRGSGKTELLIQRYLRLLGTVDDPEEVLAITFTRKAAAEMQLRVLDALRREAEGVVPEEPHLQITAGLAKQALKRSTERGWGLLGSPRRMRILTLDALNASIARAQPLGRHRHSDPR